MSFEKEANKGSIKIEEGRWSSTLLLTVASLLYGVAPECSGASDSGVKAAVTERQVAPSLLSSAKLENKRALLQKLLRRLDDRAEEAGDPGPLRREQQKAADLNVRAILAAERGEELLADQLLSDAIAMVTRVLRSATPRENSESQKRRYNELAENVTAFRQSLVATAKDRNLSDREIDLERIDAWIHQAAQAAGAANYRQANTLLTTSYQLIVSSIARYRDEETVYHALHFADAREEYRYEQQRYISHELLVRMMLGEEEVTQARQEQLNEFVRSAEKLHRQAYREWQNGEQQLAIETEVRATRELIKALRLAGLYVPE